MGQSWHRARPGDSVGEVNSRFAFLGIAPPRAASLVQPVPRDKSPSSRKNSRPTQPVWWEAAGCIQQSTFYCLPLAASSQPALPALGSMATPTAPTFGTSALPCNQWRTSLVKGVGSSSYKLDAHRSLRPKTQNAWRQCSPPLSADQQEKYSESQSYADVTFTAVLVDPEKLDGPKSPRVRGYSWRVESARVYNGIENDARGRMTNYNPFTDKWGQFYRGLGHDGYQWWPEGAGRGALDLQDPKLSSPDTKITFFLSSTRNAVLRGCGRLASRALLTSWAAAETEPPLSDTFKASTEKERQLELYRHDMRSIRSAASSHFPHIVVQIYPGEEELSDLEVETKI